MLKRIQKLRKVTLALMVCVLGGTLSAQAACPSGTPQVIIFHAGSLNNAFKAVETAFTTDTGICVNDQAFGSLDLVRQATAGGLVADIVAPADNLDIDLFLKRSGYADYDIRFASGKMVLAYMGSAISEKGYKIDDGTAFNPPTNVPNAVANWYTVLLNSNITIGGSHLYLDPSGYRAPMIFKLAQKYYGQPNLYNNLLEHMVVTPAVGAVSGTFALGKNYDFQFTYEHSAQATAKNNADYRYVNLPDELNLGSSDKNCYYKRAVVVVPDIYGTGLVPLPASKVTWGVTVLKKAPNKDNAIKFLQYLLGTVGQAALTANGPAPIIPAAVSGRDYNKIPKVLKSLVQVYDDSEKECGTW